MRRSIAAAIAAVLALPASWVGAVPVSGAGTVTIYRDSFGVPHIVAETREAAAFGVGYSLGRDRLFQLDVIRRIGKGRLAEILGEGELSGDREIRREFYDRADVERQYALLPDAVKRLLQAYADGINTAMAEQTANPAEMSVLFPALGYVPEPWRPQDSAAVLLLFTMVSFAGTGAGGELANAQLLADLAGEHGDLETALAIWQDVLLRVDPDAPAVVPHGEGPDDPPFISASEPAPEQIDLALSPGVAAAAAAEARMRETIQGLLDRLPVPRIGSYMIAATGERTASGTGMLLGAPQAGMFAPALFYELGIHAPGWACAGMTVPGLGPFIGIGACNDHAWSFVAGNAGDQVDLYVETLCTPPGDAPYGYLFESSCRAMEERTETYLVRSTLDLADGRAPRTVSETIYSTVHGPVFHLDPDAAEAYVFARSQAGHFVGTMDALYHLNVASSLEEIEAEVAARTTASYNFLYADRAGNIAYRFTGWQPVRHERIDHRLPVPGTGEFEWQARALPLERMPHVVNPSTGALAVNQGADSKPAWWWPRTSDRFIGRFGRTRADREILAGEQGIDLARMKELNRLVISEVDTLTPQVGHLIEEALAGEDPGSDLGRAFALYQAWRDAGFPRVDGDGDGRLDDPAIAIFGADSLGFGRSPLWDRFIAEVWVPVAGQTPRGSIIGRLGQTLAAIESPELFTFDYATGWQEAFRTALAGTLVELSGRFGGAPMEQWRAAAPGVRFSAIGLLAPGPIDVVDHGSYAIIADLGRNRAVSVLPPGNGRADRAADIVRYETTGEFPPHFADQVELYEAFEFKDLPVTAAQFLADTQSVQILAYPGVLAGRPSGG